MAFRVRVMRQHNTNETIVITGFMGTGKSTVAPLVAEKLGRKVIETDTIIERDNGMTIPQIFAKKGESFFREQERQLCYQIAKENNMVVSTGGGMLIKEENQEILLNNTFVMCLTASKDVITTRLADTQGRPLASNWQPLYEQRLSAYQKIPYQVDTSNKTPEMIVDEIISCWQKSIMQKIVVHTPQSQYDIVVQAGLLKNIQSFQAEFGLDKHVVVISDTVVAPIYGEQLVQKLPNAQLLTMPTGEEYKNLATVEKLYGELIALGADRKTTIVALGGGVVGDTVGFVAASYMRGVPFVQIPTSLLAMVDSSVGGKVGVDLPQGKNLVGAFKQPEIVLIDPDVLQTLPVGQWRCGMAEVIKHGFLADETLLDPRYYTPDHASELIQRAVQVKVDVVEKDPYEQNIRAHLNLGHTFAHAIERITEYGWLHGEAVGIGLLAAIKLSYKLNLCDGSLIEMVDTILAEIGLPRHLQGLNPKEIYEAMKTDKKWVGGKSHFIVINKIGEPAIVQDVSEELIIAVLDSLQ